MKNDLDKALALLPNLDYDEVVELSYAAEDELDKRNVERDEDWEIFCKNSIDILLERSK